MGIRKNKIGMTNNKREVALMRSPEVVGISNPSICTLPQQPAIVFESCITVKRFYRAWLNSRTRCKRGMTFDAKNGKETDYQIGTGSLN